MLKSKTVQPSIRLPIETDHGTFQAAYSHNGLATLDFPGRKPAASSSAEVSKEVRQWHKLTTRALSAVLSGRAAAKLPPLDMSAGTDFQRQVWRAMQRIRTGQTRGYAEIAREIGRPKAVRAVGGACGANPIPVLVPCHRVLAANRRLGGFSGGIEWKIKLLAREGVAVRA
ncbi:MAG: methylated-DNA--[protein]-cysteine S-methyltransferase [Verrucomicrobiota bacterium]